ncbi:MAG: Gfo/Idh/MocA family oxidoreductase [Verrucomicrobia bacterium]|nr:Gfo/Idh/MocA family oxidoreductase [Verrucomicrobiota bacterium]MBI3868623.1 Gfo/Idh/MocA family oxidoreductase [Verrucomicrobiota bacterium]
MQDPNSPSQLTRREFQKTLALGAVALGASAFAIRSSAAGAPSERLRVAVIGLGRGAAHLDALLAMPDVEVAYVCDVDQRRWSNATALLKKHSERREPKAVQDLRRVLDDKSVDAVFIATPNHWHAVAAILACQAGKHVYVEKPGSHNAREAIWLVDAARRHRRVVQMGNQRRSWTGNIEAVARLQSGAIGRVYAARCWYNSARVGIGHGVAKPPPAELDYALWQGPAPEKAYVDNVVHYNWHWRWHWGGGELANNGIHALDIARWGLGVTLPRKITFGGGRYHYDDDQETPDTGVATFDYGDKMISWDNSSCHARSGESTDFVHFYGDGGILAIDGGPGYSIRDTQGKELERHGGKGGEAGHIANFLDAIRGRAALRSDIAEGQTSTLLCHLGNIAYRTQTTVLFDPEKRAILRNPEAQKLWGREYRPRWEKEIKAAVQG